jgi:8-oxo-dGTP diphosphatase
VLYSIGMTQVVAAILERDGQVLICRRRPDQPHPLKWEFPGGKVEPGETAAQALARELSEELDIRSAQGRELTRYEYAYLGKKPILLIFFRVERYEGDPKNLVFHEMRWEPPHKLASFDFLEGDRDFLTGLYTGTYGNSGEDGRPGAERVSGQFGSQE